MYKEILQELTDRKFLVDGYKCRTKYIGNSTDDIVERIESLTSFLADGTSIRDRIKAMVIGLTEQPRCYCGEVTRFSDEKGIFSEYCSRLCAARDPVLIARKQSKYDLVRDAAAAKRASTMVERYGAKTTLESPVLIEKVKKTNLEKYGSEQLFASPIIKERIKETNIEKYGVPSPAQNQDILDKMRNTMIERYGVPHAIQNPDIKRQILITRNGFFNGSFDIDEKTGYYKAVSYYTGLWDVSVLENSDKRGRLDLREDAYHLDHIISTEYGFSNKIPPQHIGHICNFRFLPARDNIIKSSKCGMTYDELLEKIACYESTQQL